VRLVLCFVAEELTSTYCGQLGGSDDNRQEYITTGAKPGLFRLYAQTDYEFVKFTEMGLYL
jgi:hypothetical protein